MRKLTLIALLTSITFLIVCCVYTTGVAKTETVRGKIEMNLPDVPTPKVVINLDQTFFNLLINFGIASTLKIAGDEPIDMTEYAEMLKGAAIRTYDKETDTLNQITEHYQSILEDEKWEHLVKIQDKFDLSLLYSEEPGILHGIFLRITDDEGPSFVNIYGEINFQKLGVLFGRFLESNSEEGMSETIRNWVNAPKRQPWKIEINSEKPDEASKSESEESDEAPKSETDTNDHSK